MNLVLLAQFQMGVNLRVYYSVYIDIRLVVGEKLIIVDKNCMYSNVENTLVALYISHRPH